MRKANDRDLNVSPVAKNLKHKKYLINSRFLVPTYIKIFVIKNFFLTEECKFRWKNIRDNYFKNKRKQKLGTGSAASSRPIKWTLFEHLKFLELVKTERRYDTFLCMDKFYF